jgi:hypothetical protein
VSELRLRGLATLEAGNAFVPEFLADFRRRFARAPAEATAAWRPAPPTLDRVLSCRYDRVVARDNTVGIAGRWAQIPPGPHGRSYAGCRVEVRELLDGRLLVFYQGLLLVSQAAPSAAFALKPRAHPSLDRRPPPRQPPACAPTLPRVAPPPSVAAKSRPSPTHPWRTPFKSLATQPR